MILFGIIIIAIAIVVTILILTNKYSNRDNIAFTILAVVFGIALILTDITTKRTVETEFIGTQSYIEDLKLPEGVHAEMYIISTTPVNKFALYKRVTDTTYKVVLDGRSKPSTNRENNK